MTTQGFGSWETSSGNVTTTHEDLAQQLQLLPKPLNYELLDYFCCLNYAQRRNFILDTLTQMKISHRVLRTKEAFHIIVQPEYELEQAATHTVKCFVAHYDQTPRKTSWTKTPRPNDNSAAVWHLLNLAAQMKRESPIIKSPLQIIFSDREELRPGEDISKQGAYLLAEYLRQKYPERHYTFFVFDQCGIGDTLCYLPNSVGKQTVLAQQDDILQDILTEIKISVQRIRNYQYYFSDNLGLNLWGYPALLFSTLPQEDVAQWQKTGKKPATWQNIRGLRDTLDLLEARSFVLMNQVLSRLCRI